MSNLDLQTLLAAAYGGQGGSGGGGGTGTSNYNDLSNRPKINGVTLSGDKTPEDLGIPTMTEDEKEKLEKVKETDTELSETSENNVQNKVVTGALKAVQEAVEGISDELDKKVDAETGKGLSTNDYDNTAKGIVDGITAKVDGKVDKVTGKGLSTNDFTNALKTKLDDLPTIAAAVDGNTYTGADIADGGSTQAMQINAYNKDDSTYDAQAVNFSQNGITKYVRQKSDGSWKADATFMPDAVLQPILDAKAAQSEVNALANAGAKNLLKNGADSVTKTYNGVTATLNSDGSLTINGTATSDFYYYFVKDFVLKAGKYILSNGKAGNSNVMLQMNGEATASVVATDAEVTLETDATVNIFARVRSGGTANNITFYPMLRDASITDSTYQPYCLSNAQITQELSDTGWITPNATDYPNLKYRRKNGYVTITQFGVVGSVDAQKTKTLFTLPEGFRPSVRIDSTAHLAGDTKDCACQFIAQPTGDVNVWANTEIASGVSVCGSICFPV